MARLTTKPDGAPNVPPEEVITRASRNPWRNPQISEEQLRANYERNAANQPIYDAANDPTYEEVEVRAKRHPKADADYVKQVIQALMRRPRGRGAALSLAGLQLLQDFLQQAENDLTTETMNENDAIQDALLDPAPSPFLEEVKIFGKVLPNQSQQNPASIFQFYKDLKGDPWAHPAMELVTVTAKRTKTGGHLQEIIFPWTLIETVPVYKPYPVIDPDYRPFPESLPEPLPEIAPKKPPKKAPDAAPVEDADYLPGKYPYMQGNISVSLDARLGLRVRIQRDPARNREENKLRRDRKDQAAAKMYRRILIFVNATYGEYDELRDLYQAVMQNIKRNGVALYDTDNPLDLLMRGIRHDDLDIDIIQMAVDVAANQVEDKMFGKLGQINAKTQQGLGLAPGTTGVTKQGIKPKKRKRPRRSFNDWYGGP